MIDLTKKKNHFQKGEGRIDRQRGERRNGEKGTEHAKYWVQMIRGSDAISLGPEGIARGKSSEIRGRGVRVLDHTPKPGGEIVPLSSVLGNWTKFAESVQGSSVWEE